MKNFRLRIKQDYLAELEERESYADIDDEYYRYSVSDEEILDRRQRAADITKEFKS